MFKANKDTERVSHMSCYGRKKERKREESDSDSDSEQINGRDGLRPRVSGGVWDDVSAGPGPSQLNGRRLAL